MLGNRKSVKRTRPMVIEHNYFYMNSLFRV